MKPKDSQTESVFPKETAKSVSTQKISSHEKTAMPK